MKISSLIVLRTYPRHRNFVLHGRFYGSENKLHLIKIQNEPDEVKISREYYLTIKDRDRKRLFLNEIWAVNYETIKIKTSEDIDSRIV